jgi:phosphohistidine phosphatase
MTTTRDPTRSLLVLRHAKSSWDAPGLRDHDRPLAPRGRDALPRLARWLATEAPPIDLVLCSSAVRATQTLAGVEDALPAPEVTVEDGLYGASAATLLARLREVPTATRGVLLVGHNPGLADLVGSLAGRGSGDALERARARYPTGGLATLSVVPPWAGLTWGACSLDAFVVPREL